MASNPATKKTIQTTILNVLKNANNTSCLRLVNNCNLSKKNKSECYSGHSIIL